MSLHVLADHMASKGRGPDSMLVHMSPREVAGLHALALKHGGSLTINPDTGLPEAGFLDKLLPTIIGGGISYLSGGLIDPMTAAAMVGGFETVRTGSLERGLMAGFGAYGGAGLTQGFMGAGIGAAQNSAMGALSADQIAAEMASTELTQQGVLNQAAADATKSALANPGSTFSAGFNAVTKSPEALGSFAKDNLKYLAGAASPILAGAMVPTTTKMPEATNTGYIRQKVYDPGTQTYRSLTPIKANEFKDKSFSDIYRGYNGGGIVALAHGGMQHYEDGGLTAPDYRQMVLDAYGTIGRTGVGENANQVDAAGADAWTKALETGQIKPEDWNATFQTAVTDYIATNPDNKYSQYVKDYQAKQAGTTGAKIETADGGDIGATSNATTSGGITSLGNVGDINYVAKDPGIITATNQYFAANPDVAAAYKVNNYGLTPEAFAQTHYEKFGSRPEEKRASPLAVTSNSNAYLLANPDVAAEYARNSYGLTPEQVATYHSAKYGNAEQRATPITEAQNMVANMYRNVLGRDPDPEGLAFWSNAIAAGRSPESIYKDFLASARANTELVTADQVKNATFADATKAYKGYTSADTTNIVDEWVRNTLGREPTAADKQQQWYKDAYSSMKTQEQAKGLYGQFQTYAGAEAKTETANRIAAIDAELKAKGLTEADLIKQTGKTKQQLATEGLNTDLNWMGASQLNPLGKKTAFDLKAKLAALKAVTTPQTNAPAGTTNPYGNATNPGDITRNADGTITVQPNIPGRPFGGFSGMDQVKNAYTQGGGSLGYTSPVVKTPEELDALYNRQTDDSKAAYDYLMGKGKYPTKSGVGEIARPYKEATLGYAPSTNKPYNYDATTGKMVRNPDYVAPSRDAAGNVNYTMSLNEVKKYLTTNPLTGQALFDWAQSNGVSAQDVADATGRKLSDVYAEFRGAAKKAATAASLLGGTPDQPGGMYIGGDNVDSSPGPGDGQGPGAGEGGGGATGDCVDPNVHILLAAGGTVRAGDLKIGDMLYTLHDTTFVYGNYPVEYLNILQRPKVEALFDDGQKIIVSIAHKFLTADNQWEKISDIKIGTSVRGFEDVTKKLVSITDVGTGPVVEMVVTEAHTYISEGLVSHNKYYGGLVNGKAAGGMAGYAVGGGLGSLGAYSDGGRLLRGPGDGVSDSIPATIGQKQQPARLADGEFVVPARIVSELGNGSTEAGAKKLYAMMDRVQRARGKTTGKNKVAANSRADKYLPV